jgi:hypothetical protein
MDWAPVVGATRRMLRSLPRLATAQNGKNASNSTIHCHFDK